MKYYILMLILSLPLCLFANSSFNVKDLDNYELIEKVRIVNYSCFSDDMKKSLGDGYYITIEADSYEDAVNVLKLRAPMLLNNFNATVAIRSKNHIVDIDALEVSTINFPSATLFACENKKAVSGFFPYKKKEFEYNLDSKTIENIKLARLKGISVLVLIYPIGYTCNSLYANFMKSIYHKKHKGAVVSIVISNGIYDIICTNSNEKMFKFELPTYLRKGLQAINFNNLYRLPYIQTSELIKKVFP